MGRPALGTSRNASTCRLHIFAQTSIQEAGCTCEVCQHSLVLGERCTPTRTCPRIAGRAGARRSALAELLKTVDSVVRAHARARAARAAPNPCQPRRVPASQMQHSFRCQHALMQAPVDACRELHARRSSRGSSSTRTPRRRRCQSWASTPTPRRHPLSSPPPLQQHDRRATRSSLSCDQSKEMRRRRAVLLKEMQSTARIGCGVQGAPCTS